MVHQAPVSEHLPEFWGSSHRWASGTNLCDQVRCRAGSMVMWTLLIVKVRRNSKALRMTDSDPSVAKQPIAIRSHTYWEYAWCLQ